MVFWPVGGGMGVLPMSENREASSLRRRRTKRLSFLRFYIQREAFTSSVRREQLNSVDANNTVRQKV